MIRNMKFGSVINYVIWKGKGFNLYLLVISYVAEALTLDPQLEETLTLDPQFKKIQEFEQIANTKRLYLDEFQICYIN